MVVEPASPERGALPKPTDSQSTHQWRVIVGVLAGYDDSADPMTNEPLDGQSQATYNEQ